MECDVAVAGDNDHDELGSTAQLSVEDVSYVKPEHIDPPAAVEDGSVFIHGDRILVLSSLDLLHLHSSPHRRLLFYEATPSPDLGGNVDVKAPERQQQQADMVDRLKIGLASALCHFYPLAGKLVRVRREESASVQDGNGGGGDEFECSDVGGDIVDGRYGIDCRSRVIATTTGGVPFIVCASAGPLLPLLSTGFRPRPFFDELAPRLDGTGAATPPLLSIQVTKFTCGGIAVGFANHSGVADGHAMWLFMNSWARLTKGESLCQIQLPFHDRTFFTAVPFGGLRRWKPQIDIDISALHERLFHFSSPSIAALVRSAGDHPSMLREFNAYEVVCAHLWKYVTRARLAAEADGSSAVDTAHLSVMGDMRFRVAPPLPSSYFGNAAMTAVAKAIGGDLIEEPLGRVAFRIHEACKSCNEPNMWAMLGTTAEEGGGGKSLRVSVVSSHKYEVYGVDFGWGKPSAVRTAGTGSEDGRVVLLKAAEEDGGGVGMDVCVTLEWKAMRRLVGDADFLAAATLV